MNTAIGNSVLNYTGNVGLGLNNEGIAEYGNTDAAELNKGLLMLSIANMNKNKAAFEERQREKKETEKLLASGVLQINQVLPEDRPKLQKMIDEVKNVYLKNNGDVKSDPAVFLDFQDKLAKFGEANLYAKSRFLEIGKQEANAATETDPDLKAAKLKHVKTQRESDLYKDVLPYQQTLDYSLMGDIIKNLPVKKGDKRFEGDFEVEDYVTDLKGSRDIFINDYSLNQNKPQARRMELFSQQWLGNQTDPNEKPKSKEAVVRDLQRVNNALANIRGNISQDDPMFSQLGDIEVSVDPQTGVVSTEESVPDLIWKVNLATQFTKGSSRTLNKDISGIELNRAKVGTEKADQVLKGKQGTAAIMKAQADLKEADANAAKKWAEIAEIKDKNTRRSAEGDFVNTQALQMFDVNRFANMTDIIEQISPEQLGYLQKSIPKPIGTTVWYEKQDIASAVYDYTNEREPKIIVTLAKKEKDGQQKKYTIRPADVRLGVIKSVYGQQAVGKEGEYIANVEENFLKRSGSRDFNANAIQQWNKERGKVKVRILIDDNGNKLSTPRMGEMDAQQARDFLKYYPEGIEIIN